MPTQPNGALKRALFLLGGVAWLMMAAAVAYLLVRYLGDGAGLQFFGPWVSAGSVLFGWIHVVGLMLASGLAAITGIWWCACALVSNEAHDSELDEKP